MRITWSLALISLGSALVYSTRDDLPGFSGVRALGLALLALGGAGMLPHYPGRTHPGAPARLVPAQRSPVPARSHAGPWPAAAPVSGPAMVRPAHHLVPLPALPAPGLPMGVGHAELP